MFQIHGYASLLVCLFGSIANILNIAVLTRKEMRTPTNIILTGLAIADLCVMLDYLPFSYQSIKGGGNFTYSYAAYMLFHAHFSQLCHTASIWLTVILAVWRYIAVAYPQKNRDWCHMRTTVITIISIYILCPVILIPQYILLELKESNKTNKTVYYVDYRSSEILLDINYWIYSFLMKLIPCVLLTFLSLRLIFALIKTKKRREKLVNSSHLINNENSTRPSVKKSRKLVDKEKQTDRTTKMLLAVLLLFLITEFPQGILGLLNYMLGKHFARSCYHPLGDVLDILALFNSAINFMIYCTMSRQFRKTFSLLFKPKILNKWMPVNQLNSLEKDMTQVTQV